MFHRLIAGAVIVLTTTAVLAQADIVATRKAVMGEQFGRQFYRVLPDMLKGTTPYNQAAVDTAFTQFSDGAKKLSALYPDSTKDLPQTGRYGASQKVWSNRADFDAKLANFAKAVEAGRARSTSLDGLKEGFATVDRACDSCHEVYRIRN